MSRKKPSALKKALTPANVLENEAYECAKIKQRNRSIRSKVLKTKPEWLGRVVVVNPASRPDEAL